MKIVVKTAFRDMVSFILHLKKRNRIFRKGSKKPLSEGKMNILARRLHPLQQMLIIESVKQENDTTFTYRLVPAGGGKISFFRAGQYITVDLDVDGTPVSRPFSISSTPEEAARYNFYEITVKIQSEGFVTPYIKENWKTGTVVYCSEPMGFFYYEPLRDSRDLICLAGGTGITPFRSIIKDILENYDNTSVVLFYGVNRSDEILFSNFFKDLSYNYPERFKMIFICAGPDDGRQEERGYISSELILKHLGQVGEESFFICGPENFHNFLDTELERFDLPRKNIRRENYNIRTAAVKEEKPVRIDFAIGLKKLSITSIPGETILASMERAELHPPANCRSGECGWCRSKLVSGKLRVEGTNDGRRLADNKFRYFHPCSSYALTDLEIVCPENPRKWKRSKK